MLKLNHVPETHRSTVSNILLRNENAPRHLHYLCPSKVEVARSLSWQINVSLVWMGPNLATTQQIEAGGTRQNVERRQKIYRNAKKVTVYCWATVKRAIRPFYFVSGTVPGASYKHLLNSYFLLMFPAFPSNTFFSMMKHHYNTVWNSTSYWMENFQISDSKGEVISLGHLAPQIWALMNSFYWHSCRIKSIRLVVLIQRSWGEEPPLQWEVLMLVCC